MRLTQSIRADIVAAVVTKTFEAKERQLVAEYRKVGPKLYELLVPEPHRSALESLPVEYVIRRDGLSLTTAGHRHAYIDYSDCAEGMRDYSRSRWSLGRDRVIPCFIQYGEQAPEGSEAERVVNEFHARASEYIEARRNIEQQVRAILAGVTTRKKLEEIWPEIGSFYKFPVLDSSGAGLPALPIGDLMAQIKAIKGE